MQPVVSRYVPAEQFRHTVLDTLVQAFCERHMVQATHTVLAFGLQVDALYVLPLTHDVHGRHGLGDALMHGVAAYVPVGHTEQRAQTVSFVVVQGVTTY